MGWFIPAMFAISAGANLYSQYNSRRLYGSYKKAYSALDKGYSAHLARYGLRQNPNRAMLSYRGHAMAQSTNIMNSYAGSIGTTAGSIGAGLAFSGLGKTYKWL